MHSKFKLFISAILCFTMLGLTASCSGKERVKSAVTAFADTESSTSIPADSLSVVEALQNVFRSVSSEVLKSVVEVDVVETKTRPANPFADIPFFFFGQPNGDNEGSREYKQSGLGSGVIVRKDGNTYYVLTNEHVAGSADEISVKLYDSREFTCKLVGKDERKDIALLSFESKDDIPVASLGDSDKVQSGDICFAMGTPLGYFGSVTQGIVSATGRDGSGIGNISDFIQTDAAINQGNSGGPLVNIYGEIIGINTWIASQSGGSQGLGFAIPINNVKKAISDFISDGKVTYGWMGVSLTALDKDYEKALGIDGKKGAFVAQIFLNSPAAKGGIQAGDFIIALNGKNVKDVDQLVRDVGDLRVGETADFTVIRGGKEIHVSVKIEGRDDSVVTDNSKLWPGFMAHPITEEIRKEMKLDNSVKGVVVTNVQAKSPAAALRIQNGDIITAVNGKPVTNISEFYNELVTKQKEIWFELYTSEGHKIETSRYRF
ncbi:MAG: DegQ family serine endoprotease [Spirochaetaceae bacterium]|nr:DegQ family serine endoprotease [Spirochaetaceae bacterium]MBQ3025128.1 DegQ family serine endoprotease [Spirochaetaceae bacterium]